MDTLTINQLAASNVFSRIKNGTPPSNLYANELAEFMLDSSVSLVPNDPDHYGSGELEYLPGEVECYDTFIQSSIRHATEVLCSIGFKRAALDIIKDVLYHVWYEINVLGNDVDYSVLNGKLAFLIASIERD